MSGKMKNNFGLVLSSDEKYLSYLKTAIKSIRRYNKSLPVRVYGCRRLASTIFLKDSGCVQEKVNPPAGFKKLLGATDGLEHSLTRIAKLTAMSESSFDKLMYLDSDIVVLDDIKKITSELKLDGDKPIVYLLLRRPQLLTITDIGWLYFKKYPEMTPKQLAGLVNDTFSTSYSVKGLLNIRCWNGGIVYGLAVGVNLLAKRWKELYLKMLTGKNRSHFIPNDQLCLWLAIDQLEGSKLEIRELPLIWNYMPGHAMEKVIKKPNPNLKEIKACLRGVKVLHLAQNKTDIWAQILINEINSY